MRASFPELDDSQKQVLRLIRKHEAISGAELARLTNLQPSTMVYILRKLHKLNLIEQTGTGTSTGKGGKKPTLWSVQSNRFHILGLEILPTRVRCFISDITGNVVKQDSRKLPSKMNEESMTETVINVIKAHLSDYYDSDIQILGAGIAVPGLVDSIVGTILYSSSLKVCNYQLLKQLTDEFDFPVFLANDANAASLTVPWYNSQTLERTPQDFVYLLYTQGAENLGSGLFINGELFQGFYGTAGEIFTPLPKLEVWLNEGWKSNIQPNNLVSDEFGQTELSRLVEMAEEGCPLSSYVVRKLMSFIGDEIIRIVGFINPEEVILGGELAKPQWVIDTYLSPFLKEKSEQLQPLGYQLPEITYSTHGKFSVSLGATAIVLNEFI